jgi:hypothetical protein
MICSFIKAVSLVYLQVFPLGVSELYATACMFTEEQARKLYNRQKKKKVMWAFGVHARASSFVFCFAGSLIYV